MKRLAALICLTVSTAALAAPPPEMHPLGKFYRLNQMETASALRLTPDGQFEWAWSQGALDVETSGRWRREGDQLILTSTAPASSIFCCLAHFQDLRLVIQARAVEMDWNGEKLRYEAEDLADEEG